MAVMAVLITCIHPLFAESDKKMRAEVVVGADFVTNYIWRGQKFGGISLQPFVELNYGRFSASAWGSLGLDWSDPKEIDLAIAYQIAGLSIGVTDYYSTGEEAYLRYKARHTAHVFEGNIDYDFGFMALSWNTVFAGSDYYSDEETKRSYSSYMQVGVPFEIAGLEWCVEVGATPYRGVYASAFAVVNVSLEATKNIYITNQLTVPVFGKLIANPADKSFYFVAGFSF